MKRPGIPFNPKHFRCLYDTPMLALGVALIDCIALWLIGPAGLLLLVAGLIAVTFAAARVLGGPRPPGMRLTVRRRIALWAGEIAAAWSLFLFWLPLERWLMPRDCAARVAGGTGSAGSAEGGEDASGQLAPPPVLLIHGYVNNAGALWRLWKALVDKGLGVYTLNLEPVYSGIDRYAPLITARVNAIRRTTGAAAVTLVCHSMGGLAARAYFRYCAEQGLEPGIAKVVTLGSPHHGTMCARSEWSANGRQMAPASAWLRQLAADEAAAHQAPPLSPWPCPLVSIYSIDDNVVVPQRSARLDHARNVELDGIGHMSLPLARCVIDLVLAEVAAPVAATAAAQALGRTAS